MRFALASPALHACTALKSAWSKRMWVPFENGQTLGASGSEDGTIVRDEVHARGARITLEKETKRAPFAITCGIYGAMVHTRFFGDEAEAASAYADMKRSLDHIIGSVEDRLVPMIEEFIQRYP